MNLRTRSYYGHTTASKKNNCQFLRIQAQVVESKVLEYIYSSIKDSGYLNKIESNIRSIKNVKSLSTAREKRSINEQLRNIQIKTDNLLLLQGHSSKSNDAIKFAMNAFEKLSIEKNELEQRLLKLNQENSNEEEIKDSINLIQDHMLKFERGFNKAKGSMKKRLIQNLLKQVVMTPDGLHIFMTLADGIKIPNHQIKLVKFENSQDNKRPPLALIQRASGDSDLGISGSDINKNGAPIRI